LEARRPAQIGPPWIALQSLDDMTAEQRRWVAHGVIVYCGISPDDWDYDDKST
jgi:hypothetical protein